jgi:hypothetical protein
MIDEKRDRRIVKKIRKDFLYSNLSIWRIASKNKISKWLVYRVLKKYIVNYKEIILKKQRKSIINAQKYKNKFVSEENKEKLRNNINLKKSGRRLQRVYWAGKNKLRKEVGYKGYLKVLEKYGEEHFQKLGANVKNVNSYELLVKKLLKGKGVIHHYFKNSCIPDFYKKGKYVLEVTSLYPLRKDRRTKQKTKQLKKYKKNFSEKLILITPFVSPWKRVLKENKIFIIIKNEQYVKNL